MTDNTHYSPSFSSVFPEQRGVCRQAPHLASFDFFCLLLSREGFVGKLQILQVSISSVFLSRERFVGKLHISQVRRALMMFL